MKIKSLYLLVWQPTCHSWTIAQRWKLEKTRKKGKIGKRKEWMEKLTNFVTFIPARKLRGYELLKVRQNEWQVDFPAAYLTWLKFQQHIFTNFSSRYNVTKFFQFSILLSSPFFLSFIFLPFRFSPFLISLLW